MITLDEVREAAARIAPYVRRTPLVAARCLKDDPCPDGELLLKLECLQVTGSFKARGAANKLLSLTPAEVRRGIITASGGNHGLATAYAGWLGKTKTTVFLPESASPEKAKKVAGWGATVVVKGRVWDEANREALAVAEREGLTYFHPFADPVVIAGQGTTALEILDQEPEVDDFLVAIGGGGLISGVALTAKALRPDRAIIGIEPDRRPHAVREREGRPGGGALGHHDLRSHVGGAEDGADQFRDRPAVRGRHRLGDRRRDARGGSLALVRDGAGHGSERRRVVWPPFEAAKFRPRPGTEGLRAGLWGGLRRLLRWVLRPYRVRPGAALSACRGADASV